MQRAQDELTLCLMTKTLSPLSLESVRVLTASTVMLKSLLKILQESSDYVELGKTMESEFATTLQALEQFTGT